LAAFSLGERRKEGKKEKKGGEIGELVFLKSLVRLFVGEKKESGSVAAVEKGKRSISKPGSRRGKKGGKGKGGGRGEMSSAVSIRRAGVEVDGGRRGGERRKKKELSSVIL